MSNNPAQTASQWVDSIDIKGDKVADTTSPEISLKESLKRDLQILWSRKKEGKITDEEYNKYANAAKAIFEKQGTEMSDIENAYDKAKREVFQKTNSTLENLSMNIEMKAHKLERRIEKGANRIQKRVDNLKADIELFKEQEKSADTSLRAYDKVSGHYLIEIKEFEKQLRTGPIDSLNGLALKSYFIHLEKKEGFTREILEQKIGGKDRLLQLAILWGTSIQYEAHIASGDRVGKALTTLKSWKNGMREREFEGKIFRKVIADSIKESGMEGKILNDDNDRVKTQKQLDRELSHMDYEKLIREMREEFPKGQKITDEMVRKFFEKKVAKEEQEVKKLKAEQEETIKHKTVGDMFAESNVPKDFLGDGIKLKSFSDLNSDEKKQVLDVVRENGTGISGDVLNCISTQDKIAWKTGTIEDMKAVAQDAATMRALTAGHNNGKDDDVLVKTVKLKVASSQNEKRILSREEIYKETLKQIGYSEMKFADIIHNSVILKDVLQKLEAKNLTNTQAYVDMKGYVKIEIEKADNYIIATKNITEYELAEGKKQGKYKEGFVNEIYKEDVRQKAIVDLVNNQSFMIGDVTTRLSAIHEEGKRIPLEKIGDDTCFVSKEGNNYILSINGNTEKCSGKDEVKKTIDAYAFFYDIGLKSVTPYINNFLAIVQEKNPTCPKFDIQRGILPEQQEFLFGVVDKIFGLNMESKMSEKSTKALLSDFTEMLRAIDQKHGLNASLRKKGILTNVGSLSEKVLKETLFMSEPAFV